MTFYTQPFMYTVVLRSSRARRNRTYSTRTQISDKKKPMKVACNIRKSKRVLNNIKSSCPHTKDLSRPYSRCTWPERLLTHPAAAPLATALCHGESARDKPATQQHHHRTPPLRRMLAAFSWRLFCVPENKTVTRLRHC